MKIYTYNQQTDRAGQVCIDPERYMIGKRVLHDILEWKGTRKELIAEARRESEIECHGSNELFIACRGINVLRHLNAWE